METLIVGERGQITIPKDVRERLGIRPKAPVVIEVKEDGLVIRPAVTVALRKFSDKTIKEITREDKLDGGERKKILAKYGGSEARARAELTAQATSIEEQLSFARRQLVVSASGLMTCGGCPDSMNSAIASALIRCMFAFPISVSEPTWGLVTMLRPSSDSSGWGQTSSSP